MDLLSGIVHSLVSQRYPRELFEVVLVEDRGGTEEGKRFCESFSDRLQIVYLPLPDNYGKMGFSRNYGLAASRGEFILFLDDDTVILQEDFLETLDRVFTENYDADAVVPHGHASYSLIRGKYAYHDSYFMTSRCTAYRRRALVDLGGFISDFIGQEDVEFVIRFSAGGKRSIEVSALSYSHPPLLVPNFRKPMAVGKSFASLRLRYPFLLWLLLIMNCARHVPLYLLPVRRFREMGRFSIGFVAGAVSSFSKKEGFGYN